MNRFPPTSKPGAPRVAAMAPSLADRVAPYLSIARPDHWFKNVFMLLGVLLAGFYHPDVLGRGLPARVLWAFATTCLIASSNYVINEVLDAPSDRRHPTKRFRPVPSGRVWLPLAYAEWVVLGVVGLAAAAAVNRSFLAASSLLLLMGMIYNIPPIRTKEYPYLDVLSESVNNPIRLLLGWFVLVPSEVPPVSLLIAYWMVGAYFMASKRFAEYRSIADPVTAGAYRGSFRHYDETKLLISMFFYTTCFALFLGVFIIRYKLELILIFPLIAGFVCYYLHVAFKPDSAAQKPERLYRERGLMAYLVVCLVLFVAIMFVQIPWLYQLFNVQPSPVPPLWRL